MLKHYPRVASGRRVTGRPLNNPILLEVSTDGGNSKSEKLLASGKNYPSKLPIEENTQSDCVIVARRKACTNTVSLTFGH
jgi:hypothetical protein